jgi:tellurite resistance protein TerC
VTGRTISVGYEKGRKIVVGVVGATTLVVGSAMLVLPGPAVVVLPLGLGILASEFAWARRWLKGLRHGSLRVVGRLRGYPA